MSETDSADETPGHFAVPHSLSELLDDVAILADGEEHPSLRSVMGAFGPAGALPVMIVVALIIVSPLSGIPLLSSLGGLTIAIIALQLAVGRHSLWLPGWLRSRSVPHARLKGAVERLRPVARFLDRHCQPRLLALTHPPAPRVLLTFCALAGLAMPFLELVPFSSSLLALAITATGFTLLTRDGIWATLALLPAGAAGTIITRIVI